MATSPQYAATPKAAFALISTANTNRDGTGTIDTVITAGDKGTRIERIRIQATAGTTAGMVRLYLNDGTNSRLFQEVLVPVDSVGANNAAFSVEVSTSPYLVLPPGWSLRAAPHNAETFVVHALGADL